MTKTTKPPLAATKNQAEQFDEVIIALRNLDLTSEWIHDRLEGIDDSLKSIRDVLRSVVSQK